MSKRLLFIAPVPTHPTTGGNRQRILSWVKFYQGQGYTVDYLYIRDQRVASTSVDMIPIYGRESYFEVAVKVNSIGKKWARGLVRIGMMHEDILKHSFNIEVDDYYKFDDNIFTKISELTKQRHYHAVIVSYIFLSKLLDIVPDTTLKILDTHDVFTNRWRIFQEAGLQPDWFSTWQTEEQKALNRADRVVAIQHREARFFENLTNLPIYTIGFPIQSSMLIKPHQFVPHLLYIGSSNSINVHAVSWFVTEVWAKICVDFPECILYIAGSVCEQLVIDSSLSAQIKLIGKVDQLADAYQLADIVINPAQIGTGLKIKSIEALSFRKFLISSSIGVEGIESYIGRTVLLADDTNMFKRQLKTVLFNEKRREDLTNNMIQMRQEWNTYVGDNLVNLVKQG
jgi:hypothetical protein